MKNLGGENIDVKKIKRRIGTVLKSLLVLGVVLSGVFGAYAETEGQWDSREGSAEVSFERRSFHYNNDCVIKERSQDKFHRQEKKRGQLLSWGIVVGAVCAGEWLCTRKAGICSAAAEERERRYDRWKRRGPPVFV